MIPLERIRWSALAVALAASWSFTACGPTPVRMPELRPLVVFSGVRLTGDREALTEVNRWFLEEQDSIEQDPSFLVEAIPGEEPVYPWETLIVSNDTARFQVYRGAPDAVFAYQTYAHLHLMSEMDRLADWLPAADSVEGYARERAIVERLADVWLLLRSGYDAAPFEPLDELVYANENGYLDAFLLNARAEDFEDEKEAWEAEHPERTDDYRAWFRETFGGEPPGLREG